MTLDVDHISARRDLAEDMRACRRCAARFQPHPVTFIGSTPNVFMILDGSPYWGDIRSRRPFSSEMGQAFAAMLPDVGLPPLERWFLAHAASCPNPDAQAFTDCKALMKRQIALCNPRFVLTLGATALAAVQWCGEKMTKIHGRPFRAEGGPFIDRLILPTFHPSAGTRDPKILTEVRADLSTFSSVIFGRIDLADVEVRIGRRGKIAS